MLTRLLLIVALVTFGAACGSGDGSSPADPAEPAAAPATDAPTDPAKTDDPSELALVGPFGADAELEGGCAWIEVDGERFELMLPDGYSVDYETLTLTGPDGVIAEAGDQIRVTGAEAADMASFCQIGPLWEVAEITAL